MEIKYVGYVDIILYSLSYLRYIIIKITFMDDPRHYLLEIYKFYIWFRLNMCIIWSYIPCTSLTQVVWHHISWWFCQKIVEPCQKNILYNIYYVLILKVYQSYNFVVFPFKGMPHLCEHIHSWYSMVEYRLVLPGG